MTKNENRQWLLDIRPTGKLTGEVFRWNETSIPQPSDGQVLVRKQKHEARDDAVLLERR
jgi:NADPH-dependent curcumin reductase CurA